MKTKLALFLSLLFLIISNTFGNNEKKPPIYYQSFDQPDTTFHKALDAVTQSKGLQLVFAPAYCAGLKGRALDLTEHTPFRVPLCLEKGLLPTYDTQTSFTLQLWIQTEPGAQQGTPIMSNKKSGDMKSPGWTLGTNDNGAWYWHMSDGHTQFNYAPTWQKQAINDGRWHQLTITVDRKKQELLLYLDRRNVAIYNIAGLQSLESNLRTVIGGTDEYQDWDSRGEWMAFNGRIDEVRCWNTPLTTSDIQHSYEQFFPQTVTPTPTPDRLKVQVWNIWHGGHRFGQHVGVKRTIEILKQENADIIGLIETYGSGAIIADSLGYHFYLISTNLSIMSRYPIEETIPVFKPFNSGGAIINLGNDQKIAFFDIWLHYLPDASVLDDPGKLDQFKQEELKTRGSEIESILKDIRPWTANASQIPVIMVGDFNTDSHLDWSEKYKTMHKGMTMDFPVSISMQKADFSDSFRQLHPNVFMAPGSTWSPLINEAVNSKEVLLNRIDYIYYKGNKLSPYFSTVLNHHPVCWPSDHGSVITYFYLR